MRQQAMSTLLVDHVAGEKAGSRACFSPRTRGPCTPYRGDWPTAVNVNRAPDRRAYQEKAPVLSAYETMGTSAAYNAARVQPPPVQFVPHTHVRHRKAKPRNCRPTKQPKPAYTEQGHEREPKTKA